MENNVWTGEIIVWGLAKMFCWNLFSGLQSNKEYEHQNKTGSQMGGFNVKVPS